MLCFFNDSCVGESKSRLVKAAGAESCGQRRNENCTPLWREAHFEVKMLKKLRGSEHFLKLRCSKIARRCGEKRIIK